MNKLLNYSLLGVCTTIAIITILECPDPSPSEIVWMRSRSWELNPMNYCCLNLKYFILVPLGIPIGMLILGLLPRSGRKWITAGVPLGCCAVFGLLAFALHAWKESQFQNWLAQEAITERQRAEQVRTEGSQLPFSERLTYGLPKIEGAPLTEILERERVRRRAMLEFDKADPSQQAALFESLIPKLRGHAPEIQDQIVKTLTYAEKLAPPVLDSLVQGLIEGYIPPDRLLLHELAADIGSKLSELWPNADVRQRKQLVKISLRIYDRSIMLPTKQNASLGALEVLSKGIIDERTRPAVLSALTSLVDGVPRRLKEGLIFALSDEDPLKLCEKYPLLLSLLPEFGQDAAPIFEKLRVHMSQEPVSETWQKLFESYRKYAPSSPELIPLLFKWCEAKPDLGCSGTSFTEISPQPVNLLFSKLKEQKRPSLAMSLLQNESKRDPTIVQKVIKLLVHPVQEVQCDGAMLFAQILSTQRESISEETIKLALSKANNKPCPNYEEEEEAAYSTPQLILKNGLHY